MPAAHEQAHGWSHRGARSPIADLVHPVGPAGALPGNHAGARKVGLYPTILSRAQSSQPWQLEGGPPEIDTAPRMLTSIPSTHPTISPAYPPRLIRIPLPEGVIPIQRPSTGKSLPIAVGGDLGNGAHHRRYEGVRIRSWPNAIVADFLECVTANRLPYPRDHPFGRRSVRGEDHLRHAPKPASVRHEAVDPDRFGRELFNFRRGHIDGMPRD